MRIDTAQVKRMFLWAALIVVFVLLIGCATDATEPEPAPCPIQWTTAQNSIEGTGIDSIAVGIAACGW